MDSFSKRMNKQEQGQVFLEAVVWILLFTSTAIAYWKLSDLDYRKYRQQLHGFEFRAGGISSL